MAKFIWDGNLNRWLQHTGYTTFPLQGIKTRHSFYPEGAAKKISKKNLPHSLLKIFLAEIIIFMYGCSTIYLNILRLAHWKLNLRVG